MIHTHGDMHLAMQRVQADTGAMTDMYLTRLVTRHLSHATLVGLPRLLRAYMHPPPFYLHIQSFIFTVSSLPTPSNVVAAAAGGAGLSPVLAPLFIDGP